MNHLLNQRVKRFLAPWDQKILPRLSERLEVGVWSKDQTVQEMCGKQILFKHEISEGTCIIRPGCLVSVRRNGDEKIMLVAGKEFATQEPVWRYINPHEIICKILPDNLKEKRIEGTKFLDQYPEGRKVFVKSKFDISRPEYWAPEEMLQGNILFSLYPNDIQVLHMPPDFVDIFMDIEEVKGTPKKPELEQPKIGGSAKQKTATETQLKINQMDEILKIVWSRCTHKKANEGEG